MSDSPAPASTSPYSTRFKVAAALVVTVAVGLFALAYTRSSDDNDDSIAQTGGTSQFVEALLPPEGSQVLQQATVGIDLVSGWQGTLRLDGVDIPEDQAPYDPALSRIEFTPGPGKILESLTPGRRCAQALVWQSSVGRENGERTVAWCFEVI